NKSGRHIIYSLWQRSDSPEAFYSCSDVQFGGGVPDTQPPTAPGTPVASAITGSSVKLDWPASTDNQGVTSYRVQNGTQVVATSATNSATVTGLTANTDYTFTVVALDAAGNASPASPSVAVRTGSTGTCSVSYTRPSTWNGGFTASVKITNSGTEAVRAWQLVWDFPAGQTLVQAWSSTISVVNGKATAKGASYNADVPAGGSVNFGFNANTTGAVTDPASFTLNGSACSTA
ncbi:hypothetical protein JOD27_008998, partial [Lentzea nigeriaca]|uniref:cellulose binding domain-containing protein n=1 Tax=Lentzea nigeriaca TaxID=1128665 RepID=UPI00195EF677